MAICRYVSLPIASPRVCSTNSFRQTIDVIFPLHPILLYMNPTILALLLEPLLIYTHSGLYPNRWPVHDLGRYPNATGYNSGDDEPMPVEGE